VLAIAVAEIAARLVAPLRPPVRLSQFTEIVEQRHKIHFPEVFVYDAERFWALAPGTRLPDDAWPLPGLIANGQGVREDREIPHGKAEDEIRILFLGDSTTFGYGLSPEETFVEQTETLLAAADPQNRIECINAGVPGYTLFQGWRTLLTGGFDFEPDLVVLSFGWNEMAEWDGIGDLRHDRERKAATPPGPLRHSRLCGLIWSALHPVVRPDVSGGRPRLVPYEFRSILAQIEQATSERGVDLLLLIWPSSENVDRDYLTPLQEEQFRFAEQLSFGPAGEPARVDGVAVMRAMARRFSRPTLYQDPIHTTATANRAIAEALVAAIVPWLGERSSR
jgi:lysophospholipase L1-like esterase